MLSIIMPCYGVEAFLPAALDSIQGQTCDAWELICVDDASPDASAAIVEERAAIDSRIRLVRHEVNGGLSTARNTGVAAARGRYIWFADPDDTFDPQTVARIENAAREWDPDVVVFGIEERDIDSSGHVLSSRVVLPPHEGYVEGEALRGGILDLEEATLYGYSTTKAYRRGIAARVAFEDVPLIEDFLFNAAVFDYVESAVYIRRALYRYDKRQAANLTNRFVPRYYEVHRRRIAVLFAQQRAWGFDTPEVRSRLGSLYGRYIMSALERNCDARSDMNHAARVSWCADVFSDDLFLALVPGARSRKSCALDICLKILQLRSVALALALGRVIHLVRRSAAGLFVTLRRGR